MPQWRPDKSFYPSPRMAMQAPPEKLGYVVLLNGGGEKRPDALASIDLDSQSASYGQIDVRMSRVDSYLEGHEVGEVDAARLLEPPEQPVWRAGQPQVDIARGARPLKPDLEHEAALERRRVAQHAREPRQARATPSTWRDNVGTGPSASDTSG
jgi:56kDa selenium binding protein (SBP56)